MDWGNILEQITILGGVCSTFLVFANFNFRFNPLIAIRKAIEEMNDKVDGYREKQEEKFETIEEKIDNITKVQEQHTLDILGIKVCTTEIPIEERLEAGDRFLKLGGNGRIKIRYLKLCDKYGEKIAQYEENL